MSTRPLIPVGSDSPDQNAVLLLRLSDGVEGLERKLDEIRGGPVRVEDKLLLTTLALSLETLLTQAKDQGSVHLIDLKDRLTSLAHDVTTLEVGDAPVDLSPAVSVQPELPAEDGRVAQPAIVTARFPLRLPSRASVLTIVGRALTVFGLVAILFVAFEFYMTGLIESRGQRELLSEFKQSVATGATANTVVPEAGSAVALIEIPELGLEKVIVQGTDPTLTKRGPGHFRNSPLPGQQGNSVIAGRRTTYGAPFRNIPRLEDGAEVNVTTAQGYFTYRVTERTILRAGDPDAISPTLDNRLTLVTSHPSYFARDRYVVVAELDGEPAAAPQPPTSPVGAHELGLAGDAGAIGSVFLWAQLLIAAAVIMWLLYKRWSRWSTYLITTPVALAVVLLLFESFDRLLAGTL